MMFANVYINENISNVHNVLHCFLYQPGGVVSRRDGGVSWVHWGTSISLFRCSGHTKVKVRGLAETLGAFLLYIQVFAHERSMLYRCGRTVGHLTVGDFGATRVPLFLFAFLVSS